MMDVEELPEGWVSVRLGDLGIGRSEPCNPQQHPTTEFELWSVPSFSTGEPEVRLGSEIESGKQHVRPGDVLLCKINPRINRVWLVGPNRGRTQIASTEWIVIRSLTCEPRYLLHRLREEGFRGQLMETVAGVGGSLMRARPDEVKQIDLSLPPLPEQRRIVERIEALQARSRKAREALEAVPALLEQYRQSVLAAAFRGDLTADWREQHPDAEPASALLDRIREDRRRQWEAKYPKKKYVEPDPVDAADLPELPEGWCWARIEDLSDWVKDGTHWPPPTTNSGVPFIGIRNVVDGAIKWETVDRWVSSETHEELTKRYPHRPGDVLYAAVGSFGTAFPIPDSRDFIFQRHIAHIRPIPQINSDYLIDAINSPFGFQQSKSVARGVAQPTVTLTDLKRLLVPLCPASEQLAVVRHIKRAKTSIQGLRSHALMALEGLKSLDQSVLAKAFRGELVSQEPDDEPASEMLERIRLDGSPKPAAATPKLDYKEVIHDLFLLLRASGGAMERANLELGLVLMRNAAARTAILDKTVRAPRGGAAGRTYLKGLSSLLGDLEKVNRWIALTSTSPQWVTLAAAAPAPVRASADDQQRVEETRKVMEMVKQERLAALVEKLCDVVYEVVR